MIGKTLGHYKVIEQLGRGGMGEVYVADDLSLDRKVALKFLPDTFTTDPERMARFEREAKVLASLNHSNIAAIYGLEQAEGKRFIVMELVEGETLAKRLSKGALPLDEALGICRQIAEGLEAAHEKGVIHRDLKPANVMITEGEKVKILDFGLAKALSDETQSVDSSHSPTLTEAMTRPGVILGTAAYMSPEQAKGKAVDKRTDIWAFGCILYECLSGNRPFEGETVTETLAAILRGEPDWQTLPATTPHSIRLLLKRCLQRDPNRRFRDAADASILVEESLAAPVSDQTLFTHKAWIRRWGLESAAVCLIVVALAGIITWKLKPALVGQPQPVTRFAIPLPPDQQLPDLSRPVLALSPDGSQLVYVAIEGGTQRLYLRPLDSSDARPIAGSEGADTPFFSPDGKWIGFFADGKLKKVSVNGGAASTLGVGAVARGAAWGGRGKIMFAPVSSGPLWQISEKGGTPQQLTHLAKGDIGHVWPEVLPDGDAVLFNPRSALNTNIAVYLTETGERRDLYQAAGASPRYASSGHLIYAQTGNLMAVPFDAERVEATGAAVPVLEGIWQSPTTGAAQYSISTSGSLAYISGAAQETRNKLVWVSRDGVEEPLPAPPRNYYAPSISPDGRLIAASIQEQGGQVWIYDISREALTPLTLEGSLNDYAVWSPDGKRLALRSNKEGPMNLFCQAADGSTGLQRLTTSDRQQIPTSWSSDGQLLAFGELKPTGIDIRILQIGDRKTRHFLQSTSNNSEARFSPNARWLAYASDESGRPEIYVQPYPGPGGKWQISTNGGTEPLWNRNGRELFYRSGSGLMAVSVTTEGSFSYGKPKMLFEGQYVRSGIAGRTCDVSPNGRRFLMMKRNEQAASAAHINIVLSWFEELKQKVPPGKK